VDDETAWLAAIADSPGEEVRLVFADWLEDRGDPRAEFIRLDCALARLPPDCEESTRIRRHLAEKFAELPEEWVSVVSRAVLAGCCGQPHSFYCPRHTWADLHRFPGKIDRRCLECRRYVILTGDIEVVREVACGVAPEAKCVAVDPRVELSAEAMKPTERTLLRVELYTARETGDLFGEGGPPVEENGPPF
jgi:uncharacterized protein (TIGR02996 family)